VFFTSSSIEQEGSCLKRILSEGVRRQLERSRLGTKLRLGNAMVARHNELEGSGETSVNVEATAIHDTLVVDVFLDELGRLTYRGHMGPLPGVSSEAAVEALSYADDLYREVCINVEARPFCAVVVLTSKLFPETEFWLTKPELDALREQGLSGVSQEQYTEEAIKAAEIFGRL